MPAFYAHYRFGRDVLSALPAHLHRLCTEHRALYDIGLHGPDIFFFHRPLMPNAVARMGHRSHGTFGAEFLQRAGNVYDRAPDKPAFLAYFFGFLCHLALDSICHPEVYEAQKYTGASHTAIETALDRALLLDDGIDPLFHDPCGHFEITPENASVIAPFFPPLTAKTVEKSLRSMVFYGHLLYTRNPLLRKILDLTLYVTGHHDALFGMVMTPAPDARCTVSDKALCGCYAAALPVALELIEKAAIYIESRTEPDPVFAVNFKGQRN